MHMTTCRLVMSVWMLVCATVCTSAFGAGAGKAPKEAEKADPLPAGAVAKFGAARFHHGTNIRYLDYSPDGKLLAGSDIDYRNSRGIRLWDAATGREVRTLRAGKRGFYQVAFAEGGKTLVSLGRDNVVRGWDPSTGKEKWRFTPPRGSSRFTVSSRGNRLILWTYRSAQLWDLRTRKVIRNLGRAHLAAISADGTRAVVSVIVGRNREVRLLEIPSGRQLRLLVRTTSPLVDLAMSHDGKWVAAIVITEGIRLWNAETGKQVATLKTSARSGNMLRFSPDGKLLVALASDRTLRVWDVAQKKERFAPQGRFSYGGLAFSADSRTLAVGSELTVRRWNVESGKKLFLPHGHSGTIYALAFAPGAEVLATAGADATVRLWNVEKGTERRKLVGHKGSVLSVAFSRDGKTLATGALDMSIRLWDPTGRKGPVKLLATGDVPIRLAFGPEARTLRVGGNRGAVAVWDVATKKETITPMKGPPGAIAAFSPDGGLFASVRGNLLSVWNTEDGTLINAFILSENRRVRVCALDPYGHFVLWGSGDAFGLVEIPSGKEASRIKGSSAWLRSGAVAFSPGGRIFAAGADDGVAALYDSVTKKKLREFRGHAGRITALAFSDDGKLLASASTDTTAIVWSLADVKLPAPATRPAGDDGRLDRMWADLGSTEPTRAFQTMWRLIERKDEAVEFLAARIKPTRAPDARQVQQWITQLSDREYTVRENAQGELGKLGPLIEPALRSALRNTKSLEARTRITLLLEALAPPNSLPPALLRQLRAVYVLEMIGSARAKRVLEKLSGGAAPAPQTRAAREALRRIRWRGGEAES